MMLSQLIIFFFNASVLHKKIFATVSDSLSTYAMITDNLSCNYYLSDQLAYNVQASDE